MNLTAQQLDHFQREGYVVARDVLVPAADLQPVSAEYAEVLDRNGPAHARPLSGVTWASDPRYLPGSHTVRPEAVIEHDGSILLIKVDDG